MTISKKFSLTLFLAFSLSVAQTFAQKAKVKLIERYLNEAHRSGLFNGNILIANNNNVVFKKAIGYADASKEIPLNTQYRFHIGSIAKEFDAAGIMLLQQQGKLNINDKVSKFFPDLPAWADKISISNLLQYASGLPEVKWKTVHNDDDNWRDLRLLQNLDFEPGSDYAYNNNNTFMRRRIIEKVTGMAFDQFIQRQILNPVGIKNSVIDPSDTDQLIARSFNNDFKQDRLAVPISGWTCLNLDDMYKWAQCISTFCIIDPPSTRAIIIPAGPGKQAGLGSGSMKGDRVITHVHDGAALHYQALVETNSTKGRAIIILSNQKQGNVYDISAAIEAILDGKQYQPLTH
ncbi:MAG: serine hydrolase domain-containing protein [Mucilaginibacter sp.]